MSNSIDERIVEMKFDNAKFERNIKVTNSSLENLKKNLNFEGAGKGLSKISNIASKFTLAKMGENVDKIASKFNSMAVVATASIATITSKFINAGTNLVKTVLFDPEKAGFDEYELKLGSIQTILANTSKYGTKLEDVNKSLNELNEYSDKTIYNFGEMTKNIGLFTNAGIKLESAVSMIKGFSNEAAASGTNAEKAASAAYQLSQALSAGAIKAIDWMSITNAGMGNANMKQGLIDVAQAMGTLNKDTDTTNSTLKDFKGSLEKGWLTAAVMEKYLNIQAESNEKLNRAQMKSLGLTDEQIERLVKQQKTAQEAATKVRTWSQLIGTLSESVGSGWSETFEILIGDFDEATDLFTKINNTVGGALGDMSNSRNDALKGWDALGGRGELLKGLQNVFEGLYSVIKPVGEAISEVFPPDSGKSLYEFTVGFRKLTDGFKIGEATAGVIKSTFKVFFTVLKAGTGVFGLVAQGGGLIFDAFNKILKILGLMVSPIGGVLDSFLNFINAGNWIDVVSEKLQELRDTGLAPLMKVLDDVISALERFNGISQDAGGGSDWANPYFGILEKIKEGWNSITATAKMAFDWAKDAANMLGGMLSNFGAGSSSTLTGILGGIQAIGTAIINFVGQFSKDAAGALSDIDPFAVLSAINTGILGVLVVKIAKAFSGGPITTLKDMLGSLNDAIGAFTGTLKTLQTELKAKAIMEIAVAIVLLAGAMYILSEINPDRLMSASIGLAVAFGGVATALLILDKVSGDTSAIKMTLIAGALLILTGALIMIAKAAVIMASLSWDELGRGLLGLTVIIGLLAGSLAILSALVAKYPPGALLQVAAAMVIMSGAIMILVGAVALLGAMDQGALIQGGIALGVIFGILTGFLAASATWGQNAILSGLAMMALALAIGMLTSSLVMLGLVPIGVLVQGGIMLALMLGGLVLAVKAMQTSLPGAAAIVAIALALNMLVPSIIILGLTPFDVLAKGLGALAIALLLFVGAAAYMNANLAGGAALIGLSIALLIMATAIKMLGSMDMAQIGISLLALAGALGLLIIAGAFATAVGPGLLMLGGAVALLGLAALAVGAGMLLFALGMAAFGPAASLAAAGIQLLANVVVGLGGQILVLTGVGAAFVVLGAGLLAVGLAVVTLGAGLMVMAVGLTMIAATGIIGATALAAVVKVITEMVWQIPQIAMMSGAFLALGIALTAMGVGITLVAVGGLALAGALLLLSSAVSMSSSTVDLFLYVINKFSDTISKMNDLGIALKDLANVLYDLGNNGSKVAENLTIISTGLDLLATSATKALAELGTAPKDMIASLNTISEQSKTISSTVETALTNIVSAFKTFNSSISDQPVNMKKETDKIVTIFTEFDKNANKAIMTATDALKVTFAKMAPTVGNSAEKIGNEILDGMVRGMKNSQKVSEAARRVALAALNAAKEALDINSPSREFEKLGEYAGEGFVLGLQGTAGDVDSAFSDMRDRIKTAIDNAKKTIKDANAELKRLNKNKKKNKAEIAEKKEEIKQAKKEAAAAKTAQKQLETFIKRNKKAIDAIKKLGDQHEILTKKIEAATDAYNEAVQKRDDYADSVKDQYSAIPGFTDNESYNESLTDTANKYQEMEDKVREAEDALVSIKQEMIDNAKSIKAQFAKLPSFNEDTTYKSYVSGLQERIRATEKFRNDLSTLRSIGIDDDTYRALLDQGIDSQPFVTQLINAGPEGMEAIKALYTQLREEAGYLGSTVSEELYKTGIYAAQALVDGLTEEQLAAARALAEASGDYVSGFEADLRKQIAANRKLAEDLATLRTLGLSDKAYKELVAKGSDAQPFITDLISKGANGVAEVNALIADLDASATSLGEQAAKELYEAGVNAAKGLLEGLKSEEKAIMEQMAKLAGGMIEAIKLALGIKSPSKEFEKVGGYSAQGLAKGLQKMIPALAKNASEIGTETLEALRRSLSDAPSVLSLDMDMAPVIRPVIDLTNIQNGASQIAKLITPNPIDVKYSYSTASGISLDQKELDLSLQALELDGEQQGNQYVYNQYNNSPKALNNAEIFRQTKSQISIVKERLAK